MNSDGKEDRMTLRRAFTTFSAVVLAGLVFTIFISSILTSFTISGAGVRTIIYLILMAGVFAVLLQMIVTWFLDNTGLEGDFRRRAKQALFKIFQLFSMTTVLVLVFLYVLMYVLPGAKEINGQMAVLFVFAVDAFLLMVSLAIAVEEREMRSFIEKWKEKRESEN